VSASVHTLGFAAAAGFAAPAVAASASLK